MSVYTLYSETKKTTVLTLRHEVVSDGFNDADGCFRVLYIANGNGRIEYDDVTEGFSTNDIFIFDNNKTFNFYGNSDAEIFLLKFNISNFVNDEYKAFRKFEMSDFLSRIEQSGEKIRGIHINAKKIQDAIYMLISEFENENGGSYCVISAYVILILSLVRQYLFDELDKGKINRSPYYKNIKDSIVYIEEHLSQKLTLEELAQVANMGKTNYSIAFKNVTGMTVWEYVLNTRIDFASSCLVERNGDLNITEIAMISGFDNVAHFTKVFKKIKGSTPRDFKKNQNNPCF